MKMDARVSKLKFDLEIERLNSQLEMLKRRGIVINKIQDPFIEAIFIPRSSLNIQYVLDMSSKLQLMGLPPWFNPEPIETMKVLQTAASNVLTAKAFGVRIFLDDFDQRAPSVVFCDPFTWEELPYEKLHRGIHIGADEKALHVILDVHPLTKKPFLCMRGIREYHEHPQHTGDDWMLYRKHIGLFSTLDVIWKTCVHNANPILVFQPQNLQVHWLPAGAM